MICAFGIALVLLLYYGHVHDQKEYEYLVGLQTQEKERSRAKEEAGWQVKLANQKEEQMSAIERTQLRMQDSFYQLLADGFDVNILIVGDSIGAASGASDDEHRWTSLLKNRIESQYDVSVRLTNISMGGNTSYAGYVRTMTLNDGINYDLVVLCYGQNDSEMDFELYYEAVIRSVKVRYPKASIICIQESSQRDYTEKMKTIQSIADHYCLPVADTIEPFRDSYEKLVKDGIHPNDDGMKIYCQTVINVIESLVNERHGYDPENIAAINEQVNILNSFYWLPVDKFKRNGNTFVLAIQTYGVILGIDYNFISGENSCNIFVDGDEYAAPEIVFSYDFSQRHIMVVNKWRDGETINVKHEIKVVFDEGEAGKVQADGFRGLAISGGNMSE